MAVLLAGFASLAVAAPTYAAAAPLPPTDVGVAWTTVPTAGGPQPGVELSWQEPEPSATYEWSMETFDGTLWIPGTYTPATTSGSVGIPVTEFPYRSTVRMVVRAIVAGASSAPVASPAFDTNGPLPRLTSIAGHADGSLHLTWVPQPVSDSTPNDPLDLAPGPDRYQMVGQFEVRESLAPLGPAATSLTGSYTSPHPGLLGVAPDNEWQPVHECCGGFRWVNYDEADYRPVWLSELSTSLPAVATYSLPMTITGTVTRLVGRCGHLDCQYGSWPDPGRRVVLHARNLPTGTWYPVTSTTTDSDGLFRISVTAPGTRDYRVLALGTTWQAGATVTPTAGKMTAPRSTSTLTRVVTARFTDATAYRGQKVTAQLQVLPGGTQRATLQRWTGTSWVNLKWVYLTGGVGSYTFTAVQPGTIGYRYAIPASVAPNGLKVAATTSKAFYLRTT
jgi:hypothetical protein